MAEELSVGANPKAKPVLGGRRRIEHAQTGANTAQMMVFVAKIKTENN